MDVTYSHSSGLLFQTIGGIIDLFVFPGPTPEDVFRQYFSIIGHPSVPPAWSLGYHQSKYGYKSTNVLREVVENYEDSNIPLTAIWSDIDYMDEFRTFTIGSSFSDLRQFVEEELHGYNYVRYVPIIDPGIEIKEGYKAYELGMEMDVFVKNESGKTPFEGKLFAEGYVAFPDFEAENSSEWWLRNFRDLWETVPFDGVWLDQNELTSFCDGFCRNNSFWTKWDHPPFSPGETPLIENTISLSSRQHLSLHYNTHNLYPWEEARATHDALLEITGERPFVISRSSWPGLGRFSGHWLGDNNATWEDLRQSIAGILNFNAFGIPLVGADIGGFFLTPPEDLLIRWVQLGSFYPFFRNHAHKSVPHQELYSFSETVTSCSRTAIYRRHTFLAYLYTSFYVMNKRGYPFPATPLIFEFPADFSCAPIDTQFLFGKAVLVSPVLQPGWESIGLALYLPPGAVWYDDKGVKELDTGWIQKDVALSEIVFHYRGGCIVPRQYAAQYTIRHTLLSPVTLEVALDEKQQADGELFLDDGVSPLGSGEEVFIKFFARTVKKRFGECTKFTHIYSEIDMSGNFSQQIYLETLRVYEVRSIVEVYFNDDLHTDYELTKDNVLRINLDNLLVYENENFNVRICYKTKWDIVFQIVFYVSLGIGGLILLFFGVYMIVIWIKKNRVDDSHKFKKVQDDSDEGTEL